MVSHRDGRSPTEDAPVEKDIKPHPIARLEFVLGGRIQQADAVEPMTKEGLDALTRHFQVRSASEFGGDLKGLRHGGQVTVRPHTLRFVGNASVFQGRPGSNLRVQMLDDVGLPGPVSRTGARRHLQVC